MDRTGFLEHTVSDENVHTDINIRLKRIEGGNEGLIIPPPPLRPLRTSHDKRGPGGGDMQ